ncbi:MAG: exosortase C-terminal domain/associated protein EpsI [Phycisphaerae bacterium]
MDKLIHRRFDKFTPILWTLMAATLVVAFANNFREMWIRWYPAWKHTEWSLYDRLVEGQSYYTHGPLVPVVSILIAVLLIRHTRIRVRPAPFWGGLLLVLSLLLHLLASLARVNFVSGFALIPAIAGLTLMLWGWQALARLWFPIAFLAFMVPLPEVTISQLNFRLKMFAADTGVMLSEFFGIIIARRGNRVYLEGDKQLVIANVCNGLRTLISLTAFGALYAYICRLRGGWKLLIFLLAIPVAVIANAVRIVSLIVVADVWNTEVATGFFHDASGLLIFAVAFLMMFGAERLILGIRQLIGRPARVTPLMSEVRRDEDTEEAPWPFMVRSIGSRRGVVAVAMLIFAAAGALRYQLAVPDMNNGAQAQDALPVEMAVADSRWFGHDLELDERTQLVLETEDYFYRNYDDENRRSVQFCIIFSQDNRKGTHPPDLCLEGGGNDIILARDLDLSVGDKVLPCRELVVQSGEYLNYYLYTYRCGGHYTNSFWEQQIVIFLNGLLDRNASGALIRVSTAVRRNRIADAQELSAAFLQTAVPHLDKALP